MMGLQPFPIQYFDEPDDKLGARFVTWLVLQIAENQGMARNEVNADFIASVFENLPANEAKHIREAGLEKVCRLAHAGSMAEAGRLFREYMNDGAGRMRSEIFARTGEKVKRGQRSGHAATHGTSEEKKARFEKYQAFIDSLHRQRPSLSYEDLKASAARKFGVSRKTIQRRTTNPTKPAKRRNTQKVRTLGTTVLKPE